MKVQIEVETGHDDGTIRINVVFPETGEIRQRAFTPEQLFKKLFPAKSWADNHDGTFKAFEVDPAFTISRG